MPRCDENWWLMWALSMLYCSGACKRGVIAVGGIRPAGLVFVMGLGWIVVKVGLLHACVAPHLDVLRELVRSVWDDMGRSEFLLGALDFGARWGGVRGSPREVGNIGGPISCEIEVLPIYG